MNQRISLAALVLVVGVALAAVVSRPEDTERFPAPPEVFEQGTSVEGTSAEASVPASLIGSGDVALALENVSIPDQDAVAVVNGTPIFTSEYEEELTRALESVTMQYGLDWNDPQNLAYLPSFQQQVLEQAIDKALVAQLADEQGVVVDPGDVEAEVAAVQMQVQADPTIPDWESFLAAYSLTEESIREYITSELLVQGLTESLGPAGDVVHVNASHILVETEELGQEILDRLDAGEDFATLAAEYSIDTGSKDNGGELGWFPPGMMVPEFESAAFALKPGEISGLVHTDFGYHIILVHDKEARPLDPSIAGEMDQQRFQTWFEAQKASAAIEQLYTFDEPAPAP